VKGSDFQTRLRQGELPPLIFLYGEEGFARDRAARQIVERYVPADARDFNLTTFYGKDVDSRRILEEVQTLPVFAPHRVVLVRDAHQLSAADLDLLTDYLAKPLAETLLVFVADKIDKRRKFFQQFQKHGLLLEFRPLYDNQVPAFIREQLQEDGLQITEEAMELFCRRMGNQLAAIVVEIGKLRSYLGERRLVDVADIQAVVCDLRSNSVFELNDAIGRRQAPEALRLLSRLLADGEAPLGLLTMIVRHFRQLWKIVELLEEGVAGRELPARIGVNPYFINGLVTQARNFTRAELEAAFRRFLETDLALKSSGAHASVLLEQLVLEIGWGARGGEE